jgi:DNA-binding NtrC family response regulator
LNVLLVEDQTIIALDTETMLCDLGAASVTSFTTAETALSWLADAQADVGVLDIGLGTEMSYPVGDLLLQKGIPFLFTTGYGDTHQIPPRFAGVPVVHKPYSIEGLAEALERCLKRMRGA